MEESNQNILLITGITGFLGSWVGKYALEQVSATFKIRATARNLDKAKSFKESYGSDLYDKIEWVKADLDNET